MTWLLLCALLWWTAPVLADGFICAGSQGAPTKEILPEGAVAKPAQRFTGMRRALVVFAKFRGENPGQTQVPAWAVDIFNPARPGSFSHFYDTMSFGQWQVRGQVASRVYESAREAATYLSTDPAQPGRFGRFALEILRQADQDIDFSQFDNNGPDGIPNSGDDDGIVDAFFIVTTSIPANFLLGRATGLGQLNLEENFQTDDMGALGERVWVDSRKGTIQQGRSFAEAVGVMCHEYGHVLGLPDLFNTEFLQKKDTLPEEDSAGSGAWCLMAWGALGWNGDDGPNSFCAWSRAQLGWTPVIQINQEEQEVRLEEVGSGGAVFRIPLMQDEYFLLEHRRRGDNYYDRSIPGEGLLIWHVRERDQVFFWEAGSSGADSLLPTVVDLESADGKWLDAGYPKGQQADRRQGEDNLDFWAHDAQYAQTHAGNLGDETDPFDGVRYRAFTSQTNPAAYSADGRLSVRIEDIRFAGGAILAQIQTQPPMLDVDQVVLHDLDQNKTLMAGEEVQVGFWLRHQGSFAAQAVRVKLSSSDPWVEIIEPEVQFGDLAVGESRSQRGFKWRFENGFVGRHTAVLNMDVYVGQRLAGQDTFMATGISPRQAIRKAVLVDSLGNGDGQIQRGEIARLDIWLEREEPEVLQNLRFTLRPLQKGVRLISTPLVRFGPERRMPKFVLEEEAPAGDSLQFELVADAHFSVWRDTLHLAPLAEGTDSTPPQVERLRSRPLAQGLGIFLNGEDVLDGSPIGLVEARIYGAADTALVARIPLQWNNYRYEGTWLNPKPGVYLLEARAVDQAGNQGQSTLRRVLVKEANNSSGGDAADSTFSGHLWEEVPLPSGGWRPTLTALAIAPSDPEVIYVRAWHSVWRSQDGGLSWEQVARLMGGDQVLVDAQDPFTVYTNFGLGRFEGNYTGRYTWLRSQDGGRTWESLDEEVWLLAADPLTPGGVYGKQKGELVVSADWGASWHKTKVGIGGAPEYGVYGDGPLVQAHPTAPHIAYVTTLFSRTSPSGSQSSEINYLYRSADGGQTWELQQLRRPYSALLADPAEPTGLYAASNDTLWHSADQGATWQVVAQDFSDQVRPRLHFLAHPQVPGWLLAWDERSLWRSQDGGKTWDKRVLPVRVSEGQHQIVLHPWDSQRFFLVVADFNNQKIYFTRDGGESWEQFELPLAKPPAGVLIFDPAGQLYVGAGRSNSRTMPVPRLYTSSEGGKDWQMVEGEVKGSYGWYFAGLWTTEALFVEPSDPRIVLAYINKSLLRSTDGGLSWGGIGLQGEVGFSLDFAEIMGHPREPWVYYLADSRGIFRSADFGQTWERRVEGLPPGDFLSTSFHLVMDPLRPETLYATAGNSRLWRSGDAGLSWEPLATLEPDQYIYALVIHPLEPQKLYVVAAGGLYSTEDEGQTWRLLLSSKVRVFSAPRLRLDPFDPTHLLLVAGPELLETRDGGQTWDSIGEGLTARPWFYDAAVDPGDGEVVYAATPWGVYRLDADRGITAVEAMGTTPQRFALSPNYPNPFNPTTTLRFSLPRPGEAELAIYNLLGQRVAILVRGVQQAGPQVLQWNGRDDAGRELASGVYFYRLQAGAQVETRKLLLLR